MTKTIIVFLDANILFSAAYREKNGLLRLWELSGITLTTSLYALEEAERNLKKPEQLSCLEKLSVQLEAVAHVDDKFIPGHILLPPKDRPILSAAIAIKANYLLTGDFKDFGNYFGQSIMGVKILPPVDFFREEIVLTPHVSDSFYAVS